MKLKGLIFDFGFTLFEFKDASVEKYLNSYRKGLDKSVDKLREYKILKDNETVDLFIKTFKKERNSNFKNIIKTKQEFPTHTVFQTVMQKLSLMEIDQEIYHELADLYHYYEEQEWIPLENTRETLETLSKIKAIKMAVLSNHPHHKTIENVLKKYNLLRYFDTVVTSAEFGKRKPDTEIFYYTIKKMGLSQPNSCLICGDESADIVGGHRAGLKTILCKRMIKFPLEQEINITDYIKINDISEILNHIE
jgi:HAD superfamily hydrolase (TIGR01549 family)